jgi:hypothetical protein
MISTMLLPLNVRDLLSGKAVEWERLGFKAGWNPLAILHTLCAFANDFHNLGGGYLLVGVAEKSGCANPLKCASPRKSWWSPAIQDLIVRFAWTSFAPARPFPAATATGALASS